MITKFDRTSCRLLGADIEKALAEVAAKHGVTIRYSGGSFSDANCTLKLDVATKNANGEEITKERTDFEALCSFYGFEPTDFGKTFIYGGATYTICGLKSKSRTCPILGKRAHDGKMFKFAADVVAKAIGKKKAPNADLAAEARAEAAWEAKVS